MTRYDQGFDASGNYRVVENTTGDYVRYEVTQSLYLALGRLAREIPLRLDQLDPETEKCVRAALALAEKKDD